MTVKSGMQRLRHLLRISESEEGQAMVEYALLLSLVAMAAIVGVQIFGHGLAALYQSILTKYPHS